jgi:hypothetical protein
MPYLEGRDWVSINRCEVVDFGVRAGVVDGFGSSETESG